MLRQEPQITTNGIVPVVVILPASGVAHSQICFLRSTYTADESEKWQCYSLTTQGVITWLYSTHFRPFVAVQCELFPSNLTECGE